MKSKLLGGRYRIVEILAAGGFSQTYIAEDIHRPSHPKCVVKHLVPPSRESIFLQSARRLFQAEAETLEKLGNHDQIPRLLAHFEENREFYLVQEFIAGQPLSAELPPGHCWSESQVVQLLQEVLGILEFVHSHGLIHRDIKPSNLIRRQQDNRLVLIDFGSVKQVWTQAIAANTGIPTTIAIGTPGYIATEQGRGKPRPNSDLYALGMIGIQALTGVHPTKLIDESETGEIFWRHYAQVSEGLASILTKMVLYHFKQRYQTATEVLQALQLLAFSSTAAPSQQCNTPQTQASSLQPPATAELPSSQNPGQRSLTQVHSQANPPAAIRAKRYLTTRSRTLPQAASAERNSIRDVETAKPSATQSDSPLAPSPTSNRRQPQMLMGASITAVMLTMVAGYTIYWQPKLKTSPTLEQIENLKTAGKYEQCIAQATPIRQNSHLYSDAQALLHECQMAKATQLAAQNNFPAAISEASKLPASASIHEYAQQQIDRWSNRLLELAAARSQSGKLNDAIALTQAIPETSPVYQKAQAAVKQWQEAGKRLKVKGERNAIKPSVPPSSAPARSDRSLPKRVIRSTNTKGLVRTTPRRVIRSTNTRGVTRTTPKRAVRPTTIRQQHQPTPQRSPAWRVESR